MVLQTINETFEFINSYEVKDHDNLTQFSDKIAALTFLHRVAAYIRDLSVLRAILVKEANGINVYQLNDPQMLEVLADRLLYGKIKVRRTPKLRKPSAIGIVPGQSQYMTPQEVEQMEKTRREKRNSISVAASVTEVIPVVNKTDEVAEVANKADEVVKVPDELTANLSNEAAQIISTSTKGQLRRQAALSRASVKEHGIVSRSYTNLEGKVTNFPGVKQINDGSFIISDKTAFIDRVEQLYVASNNPLHPITKAKILEHVGDGSKIFPTQAGIPGLHAEVQAVNEIIQRVPNGFDLSKINVSTIKLYPGLGQGLPFPACFNCGGILSDSVNILTGVK